MSGDGSRHRRARRFAITRATASAVLAALVPTAAVTNVEPHATPSAGVPLSAVFYTDTSCLLTIDRRPSVGRTMIDADVGAGGSRMLIHCDTEDGHRLTMLARGDRFRGDARAALLSRADIEGGEDGVIAWLTSVGVTFSDESAPRRYLTRGHVMIRETSPVQVDGTALHGDRTAFARVDGELEPLPDDPTDSEATPPRY